MSRAVRCDLSSSDSDDNHHDDDDKQAQGRSKSNNSFSQLSFPGSPTTTAATQADTPSAHQAHDHGVRSTHVPRGSEVAKRKRQQRAAQRVGSALDRHTSSAVASATTASSSTVQANKKRQAHKKAAPAVASSAVGQSTRECKQQRLQQVTSTIPHSASRGQKPKQGQAAAAASAHTTHSARRRRRRRPAARRHSSTQEERSDNDDDSFVEVVRPYATTTTPATVATPQQHPQQQRTRSRRRKHHNDDDAVKQQQSSSSNRESLVKKKSKSCSTAAQPKSSGCPTTSKKMQFKTLNRSQKNHRSPKPTLEDSSSEDDSSDDEVVCTRVETPPEAAPDKSRKRSCRGKASTIRRARESSARKEPKNATISVDSSDDSEREAASQPQHQKGASSRAKKSQSRQQLGLSTKPDSSVACRRRSLDDSTSDSSDSEQAEDKRKAGNAKTPAKVHDASPTRNTVHSRFQKDILKVGDRISYYHPLYVAGNPEGYRETVILAVKPMPLNPSSEVEYYPLDLDNAEVLPSDTRVKRIVTGRERSIEDFVLIEGSGGPGAMTGLQRQAARLGKIVDSARRVLSVVPEHLQDLEQFAGEDSDSSGASLLSENHREDKRTSEPREVRNKHAESLSPSADGHGKKKGKNRHIPGVCNDSSLSVTDEKTCASRPATAIKKNLSSVQAPSGSSVRRRFKMPQTQHPPENISAEDDTEKICDDKPPDILTHNSKHQTLHPSRKQLKYSGVETDAVSPPQKENRPPSRANSAAEQVRLDLEMSDDDSVSINSGLLPAAAVTGRDSPCRSSPSPKQETSRASIDASLGFESEKTKRLKATEEEMFGDLDDEENLATSLEEQPQIKGRSPQQLAYRHPRQDFWSSVESELFEQKKKRKSSFGVVAEAKRQHLGLSGDVPESKLYSRALDDDSDDDDVCSWVRPSASSRKLKKTRREQEGKRNRDRAACSFNPSELETADIHAYADMRSSSDEDCFGGKRKCTLPVWQQTHQKCGSVDSSIRTSSQTSTSSTQHPLRRLAGMGSKKKNKQRLSVGSNKNPGGLMQLEMEKVSRRSNFNDFH